MQQETKLKLTTYGRVLKPLEIEDYERDVGAIAKVAIVPALRCREGDFFLFSQRKDWGKIDFLVCGHMNLFDAEQLDIPIACRRTLQREFFEELGYLGNIVGRNLLKKHRLECVLKHHNIGNNSLELIQCVESEVDTQTFPVSFLSRILYALSAKYVIVEKSLALEMGTIQENLLSNRLREYLIYKSGVLLQS